MLPVTCTELEDFSCCNTDKSLWGGKITRMINMIIYQVQSYRHLNKISNDYNNNIAFFSLLSYFTNKLLNCLY